MLRITPFFLALLISGALLACSSQKAAEPAAKTTKPAPTVAEAKAPQAQPKPTASPTPEVKAAAPAVREKPSEEACRQACKRILGLAVEEVPEIRRPGAQSFMDAVVDEACPDKCMRSGTRASVACVNGAKTYAEAKACPGTP